MRGDQPEACPNCKQREVEVDFARWEAGDRELRCPRCNVRLVVDFEWVDMAPGHEEHAGYRAEVRRR